MPQKKNRFLKKDDTKVKSTTGYTHEKYEERYRDELVIKKLTNLSKQKWERVSQEQGMIRVALSTRFTRDLVTTLNKAFARKAEIAPALKNASAHTFQQSYLVVPEVALKALLSAYELDLSLTIVERNKSNNKIAQPKPDVNNEVIEANTDSNTSTVTNNSDRVSNDANNNAINNSTPNSYTFISQTLTNPSSCESNKRQKIAEDQVVEEHHLDFEKFLKAQKEQEETQEEQNFNTKDFMQMDMDEREKPKQMLPTDYKAYVKNFTETMENGAQNEQLQQEVLRNLYWAAIETRPQLEGLVNQNTNVLKR